MGLVSPITLACVYLLTGPHPLLACMFKGASSLPSLLSASSHRPHPLLAFFCLIVLSHDLIKKPTLVSDLPSSCRSLPGWGITGTDTHRIAYPLVLTNFFLASFCGYLSISASWASPQRLSKSQDNILQSSFPFNLTSHSKVFPSHTDEREVILPAPGTWFVSGLLLCTSFSPLVPCPSMGPPHPVDPYLA